MLHDGHDLQLSAVAIPTPWACQAPTNEESDSQNMLHGKASEHLQRLWQESGGDGYLEVRNSFIHVSSSHTQLQRSRSWSESGTSSQSDSRSSSRSSISRSRGDATGVFCGASDISSGSGDMSQPVRAQHELPVDMEQAVARVSDQHNAPQLHDIGKCRPCLHTMYDSYCDRGNDCEFCHLPHNDYIQLAHRRPCKATRTRCKRIVDKLIAKHKDDPEALEHEAQRLIRRHPYARPLVLAAVERCKEQEAGASQIASQISQSGVQGDCANGHTFQGSEKKQSLVSL
eukprot:TRINITY_DN27200_c0_g1_i1.p1 TRINITY_DN27200_c0_g1~~TRINITY_DN27200_c0_g1_i1.p1  ORF type:complete len:310 (+),score=49.19 TRINITY_DN27200_c0_g1_i1:75-932(+)